MADVHVVYVALRDVNSAGTVVSKDSGASISSILNSSKEHRIIPSSSVPNSSGNRTIESYLQAEYASGFKLVHIDQTMIITDNA